MRETIKITKSDLNDKNEYLKETISGDYNVEIEENLEYVKFKSISVKGFILAKAGSGIKAGRGIEAGWGIKAGLGIKTGWGIEAGLGIKAGQGIEAGDGIEAGKSIITLYKGIQAKFISCLKLTVGFYSEEKQIIKARLRKGLILGEFQEEKED